MKAICSIVDIINDYETNKPILTLKIANSDIFDIDNILMGEENE